MLNKMQLICVFAFTIAAYRLTYEHWYDIQSSLEAMFWSPGWSGCIWESRRLLENTELFSSLHYSGSGESVRACWVRPAFPSPPFFPSFFCVRHNRTLFVPSDLMPARIKRCQAAPISVPTWPATWSRRNECFFYPRPNILLSKHLKDWSSMAGSNFNLLFSLLLSLWGFAVRMNFPKVI